MMLRSAVLTEVRSFVSAEIPGQQYVWLEAVLDVLCCSVEEQLPAHKTVVSMRHQHHTAQSEFLLVLQQV